MKAHWIIILALAGSPAFAGWTLLQETRDGIVYVDRDSAEKTGSGWQVDSSQDFHRLQRIDGKEYLSARSRYDLDCGEKKLRTLSVELYPENMAGGDPVHAERRPGDWAVPEAGSPLEAIWKSFCR